MDSSTTDIFNGAVLVQFVRSESSRSVLRQPNGKYTAQLLRNGL